VARLMENLEKRRVFLPGDGFDVETGSHLIRLLGFNNVNQTNFIHNCFRRFYELTKLVCFNRFFHPGLCQMGLLPLSRNHRHDLPNLRVRPSPISLFRGCPGQNLLQEGMGLRNLLPSLPNFVYPHDSWLCLVPYDLCCYRLRGHTAGFLGLQITLIIVAMLNVYFMIDSKAEYAWLGGRKGTMAVATIYIVLNLIISPIKLYLTCNIVFYSLPAPWSLNTIGGAYIGQDVDTIWFIFNAVIPLLVGFLRAFSEPSITITIDVAPSNYSRVDGAVEIVEKTEDAEKEEPAKVVEAVSEPDAVASA